MHYLLHFSENHIPLSLNRPVLQLTVEQDVTEDINCLTYILLQHLGMIRGLLTTCEGIEAATHVLNLNLKVPDSS